MSVEWERQEPTVVDVIGHKTIVTKHFKQPDGVVRAWQTMDAEDRRYVGVIALTTDNRVVVTRQYRPGPEMVMDEIPGGIVDAADGGDPQAAALRELNEETGYAPAETTYLGKAYKDCYHNATWHYFLATGCRAATPQTLDASEFIEVRTITIARLLENAMQARMTDMEGVLLGYETLRRLQRKDINP